MGTAWIVNEVALVGVFATGGIVLGVRAGVVVRAVAAVLCWVAKGVVVVEAVAAGFICGTAVVAVIVFGAIEYV